MVDIYIPPKTEYDFTRAEFYQFVDFLILFLLSFLETAIIQNNQSKVIFLYAFKDISKTANYKRVSNS